MNDLFSIIILSYNNYSFLQTCIDSVLMQAYKRIELIVVDDKSQEFDIKSVDSYISESKDSNLIYFIIRDNMRSLLLIFFRCYSLTLAVINPRRRQPTLGGDFSYYLNRIT